MPAWRSIRGAGITMPSARIRASVGRHRWLLRQPGSVGVRNGTGRSRDLRASRPAPLRRAPKTTSITQRLWFPMDESRGARHTSDHGYWGAQLIEPYVDEEVSWAVRYHQALRYFSDESVGYSYPEAYIRYFGKDYQPPIYLRQAYEQARRHKWYMTARLITVNDVYSFDPCIVVD